jgi:hypothetical protein
MGSLKAIKVHKRDGLKIFPVEIDLPVQQRRLALKFDEHEIRETEIRLRRHL